MDTSSLICKYAFEAVAQMFTKPLNVALPKINVFTVAVK